MELTLTGGSLVSNRRKKKNSGHNRMVPLPSSTLNDHVNNSNGSQSLTSTQKDDEAKQPHGGGAEHVNNNNTSSNNTTTENALPGGSSCNHGKKCCHNHPTPATTLANKMNELNPQTKQERAGALLTTIKYGTFESFQRIAEMVEKEDELDGYLADKHTLAHWAAKRGNNDTKCIMYLADRGVDLFKPSRDKVGMHPIHWASTEGNIGVVSFLLRRWNEKEASAESAEEGNKNGRNGSRGGTATSYESRTTNHKQMTKTTTASSPLFDEDRAAAADALFSNDYHPHQNQISSRKSIHPLHVRDNGGSTPLLVSAQNGHVNLCAFLLQQGANATALDDNRDSALHWGAYKGEMSVVGLLCHMSGDRGMKKGGTTTTDHSHNNAAALALDAVDKYGQTPLHLAALRGNSDVVEYLLDEADITGLQVDELLNLADKNGKTPLDLAISKKKKRCELILREWNNVYRIANNRQSSRGNRTHSFPQLRHRLGGIQRGVKQFCSLDNWKVWMGMRSSGEEASASMGHAQRHLKWPFAFMVFNMSLALLLYPMRFIPVFGGGADREMVLTGGFFIVLHMCTLTCMLFMWITLWLTYSTEPGSISRTTANNNNTHSNKNNRNRKTNKNTELETLATKLQLQYDEALQKYALQQEVDDTTTITTSAPPSLPPLCHSCHILKPLRSKHCRVQRKCVLLFDHYCPFVGNTIGMYNYRYFYAFLFFFTTSEIGFVITWCQYLLHATRWDRFVFSSGLFVAVFVFPALLMFCYHSWLVVTNLTTNEHQNKRRYEYLQQDSNPGMFYNPFDRGCFGNVSSRLFFPCEQSFTLSSSGDDGNNVDDDDALLGDNDGNANNKDGKEQHRNLLAHVV